MIPTESISAEGGKGLGGARQQVSGRSPDQADLVVPSGTTWSLLASFVEAADLVAPADVYRPENGLERLFFYGYGTGSG